MPRPPKRPEQRELCHRRSARGWSEARRMLPILRLTVSARGLLSDGESLREDTTLEVSVFYYV